MAQPAWVADPKPVRPRVLLAEDQALIAMEFEAMLADLGCEVVGPFGRVAAALEAASTMPLDGAVLDVSLAGHRSFPIAQRLQDRGVPFFFVTGLDHTAFPAAFTDCCVLTKPIRSNDFAKLVRQLFMGMHLDTLG
jgi:DNA-binding response OmpR family regulator